MTAKRVSSIRHDEITPAIEATRAMYAAAKDARWEEMMAIESERDLMLRQLFVTDSPLEDRDGRIAGALLVIQQYDAEIVQILQQERTRVGKALSEAGRGRKGAAAYLQTKQDG